MKIKNRRLHIKNYAKNRNKINNSWGLSIFDNSKFKKTLKFFRAKKEICKYMNSWLDKYVSKLM